MTTHINPAAVSELAAYITAITKQNEHLRARVQELLEANNRELERRRAAESQLKELLKPEVSNAKADNRRKEEEEEPNQS